jgi:hypothetical protein
MRASLFRLSTCPKLLGDTAALTLFYAIGRCRLEKDCTPPQIGVSMFIVNKRRQLQQCLQPCDKQHSGSHCNSRKIQCDLGARPVPKAKASRFGQSLTQDRFGQRMQDFIQAGDVSSPTLESASWELLAMRATERPLPPPHMRGTSVG